jgi:hypothetical protein
MVCLAPRWAQMSSRRVRPSDANFARIPVLPRVFSHVPLVSRVTSVVSPPILCVCTIYYWSLGPTISFSRFSARDVQVLALDRLTTRRCLPLVLYYCGYHGYHDHFKLACLHYPLGCLVHKVSLFSRPHIWELFFFFGIFLVSASFGC